MGHSFIQTTPTSKHHTPGLINRTTNVTEEIRALPAYIYNISGLCPHVAVSLISKTILTALSVRGNQLEMQS